MQLVRVTMYSSWIFVPTRILLANFVNLGVLISKKKVPFLYGVFNRHFEFQNGRHFELYFGLYLNFWAM